MRLIFATLILFCPIVLFAQVPLTPSPSVLPKVTLPQRGSNSLIAPALIPAPFPISNTRVSMAEQHKAIRDEVEEYLQKKDAHDRQIQQLISEAYSTNETSVVYTIPHVRKPGKAAYYQALDELINMIYDTLPVDLIRATYLVESAFDPTIPSDYIRLYVKNAANHILRKTDQDGLDLSDNLVKNMMIFRYMTDTLAVDYEGIEKPILSYPKTYDFEDFWGTQDWSKMFVSKLMRDGSGQCHSLPLLYLMIAQEIGASANLAFAPNHSYIKFQDKRGNWQSLELTIGGLSSDNFILQSGFVKSEAIRSKIYMEAINDRQLIAQSINDLVSGYVKRYGYDDRNFFQTAFQAVYKVFPNSITAHQINANYYAAQVQYVVAQCQQHGLEQEQFDRDEKAQFLLGQMNGAFKHIENLGFAPMPEDAYSSWLASVEELSNKQFSKVKMEGFIKQ